MLAGIIIDTLQTFLARNDIGRKNREYLFHIKPMHKL